MHLIWAAFLIGLASAAHCLGMCGGFALHLSVGTRRRVLAHQLLWAGGRIITYTFLGAMAGYLGFVLGGSRASSTAQQWLACIAGGAMIVMAVVVLGLLPRNAAPPPPTPTPNRPLPPTPVNPSILASFFRSFLVRPTPAGALALGVVTGFLPCPVIIAGLALSLSTRSVPDSIVAMAALGAGTIPGLLLLGLTGQMLSASLRRWAPKLAAATLLLVGSLTILRAAPAFHHILGCERCDHVPPAASSQPGTCCSHSAASQSEMNP